MDMKTAGERIRQAREALGWSAHTLATKVGYKTQSGISNLENRASGSGGNKIGAIAVVLGVPLDWIINGPDSLHVPFHAGNLVGHIGDAVVANDDRSVVYMPEPKPDEMERKLLHLFHQLDLEGQRDWLNKMEGYVMAMRPHTHGAASALAAK